MIQNIPQEEAHNSTSVEISALDSNLNDNKSDATKESSREYLRSMACFEFRDTGICRFGCDCNYSHDTDVIQRSLNDIRSSFFTYISSMPEQECFEPGSSISGEPPLKKSKVYSLRTCFTCKREYPPGSFVDHVLSETHKKKVEPLLKGSIYKCEACFLIFESSDIEVSHYHTDEHIDIYRRQTDEKVSMKKLNLDDENFLNRCNLCKVDFTSPTVRENHLKGKKHKRTVIVAINTEAENPSVTSTVVARCELCSKDFDQLSQFESHILGKRHQKIQQEKDNLTQMNEIRPPMGYQQSDHQMDQRRRGGPFNRGGRSRGRGGRTRPNGFGRGTIPASLQYEGFPPPYGGVYNRGRGASKRSRGSSNRGRGTSFSKRGRGDSSSNRGRGNYNRGARGNGRGARYNKRARGTSYPRGNSAGNRQFINEYFVDMPDMNMDFIPPHGVNNIPLNQYNPFQSVPGIDFAAQQYDIGGYGPAGELY